MASVDNFSASAVDTWRYLRVAMVVMVAGLGVSVGYERAHAQASCFQTSISAYYYTPVRAVFVATLVALGLCMVCLKGNTDAEDILLNLAGMFAPVVAFVPTAHIGMCPPSTMSSADPNIANNIFTLLVIGAIGLGIVGYLLGRDRLLSRPVRWQAEGGFAAAFAVYVAAIILFNTRRSWFDGHAHDVSAALLFVCIIAVVVVDAFDYRDSHDRVTLLNRYLAIAVAMVVSAATIFLVHWRTSWQHWRLVLEATIIVLFALFWVVQTIELGRKGLRSTQPTG